MEFNTASLSEQAERALREEIMSGRLAPKQRIDLTRYAADWQVSPTPLRDAVKQLETKGLVEIAPRRGVFVADIDRIALKEIFQLRCALETMATELATPAIPTTKAKAALDAYLAANRTADRQRRQALAEVDNLVHDIVVEYCGNMRLATLMTSQKDIIQWSRGVCFTNERVPYEEALSEHIAICKAICARSAKRAAQAMRTHLENAFRRIDTQLQRLARSRNG